jgi:hypothetical protein
MQAYDTPFSSGLSPNNHAFKRQSLAQELKSVRATKFLLNMISLCRSLI